MIDPRKEMSEIVEMVELSRRHAFGALTKMNAENNNAAGAVELQKLFSLLGKTHAKIRDTMRAISEEQ